MIIVPVWKKLRSSWQQRRREKSSYLMRIGHLQGCIIQRGVIHLASDMNNGPCFCASKWRYKWTDNTIVTYSCNSIFSRHQQILKNSKVRWIILTQISYLLTLPTYFRRPSSSHSDPYTFKYFWEFLKGLSHFLMSKSRLLWTTTLTPLHLLLAITMFTALLPPTGLPLYPAGLVHKKM